MRLTKYDKEAFVRAVIADIPRVDYYEQVRSKMKAWGLSTLPADLQALAKRYPNYFQTTFVYTPSGCPSVYVICHEDTQPRNLKEQYPEFWAELEAIGELSNQQADAHKRMELKLEAIIGGCSTLKTAKERLPEFEKYLPTERGTTGMTNLPVANIIADLTNLGWPKDAPLAAKEAA